MKAIFLDRDGVVNERLMDDYVKKPEEFRMLSGAADGVALLNQAGYQIFLVTNQQGIGKGVMNEKDLEQIHALMCDEMQKAGGYLERIYYCPHLKSENCHCRKPDWGMIRQALQDFPEIDLDESFLIGDTETDIQMAKKAGVRSILIGEQKDFGAEFVFRSLKEAALFIAELK